MSPGRGELLLVPTGGGPLNAAPNDGQDAHDNACYEEDVYTVAEDFFYSFCSRLRQVGGGIDGCVADFERKKMHIYIQ